MKSLITGDKATVARLAERLKLARSHSEYQRIQCVLIRATLGSSAAEIAQLLGWSTATVHVLHSRWAKEGDTILDLRGRGGRHRQHAVEELGAGPPGVLGDSGAREQAAVVSIAADLRVVQIQFPCGRLQCKGFAARILQSVLELIPAQQRAECVNPVHVILF